MKKNNAKKSDAIISHTIDRYVNHQNELHQFSQIVSHYLRSPIAKIKSIMNHLNSEPANGINEETKCLLENISSEAEKLDIIIYDLNKTLEIFSAHEIKKYINLKKLFSETTHDLATQIEESGAIITSDFKNTRGVFTVRDYLKNVLTKLISNAIKYRSPDRPLAINIHAYEEGNFSCLEISDNGLGIDLNQNRTKVFGIYNRFHSHVNGKGTGLYLLKAGTDALGGKIKIESEVNAGTCFKIYFPKF